MDSGQGVTNYAINQPSYAYSGATTEFDDALVQRGIVTAEQVLLAKGMSVTDAERILVTQKKQQGDNESAQRPTKNAIERCRDITNVDDDDDDNSSSEGDDYDDEFMHEYQRKRMIEMQEMAVNNTIGGSVGPNKPSFGQVIYIDRTEWIRHVNEASRDCWVVVCLTSSDTERTGRIQAMVQDLAVHYTATKFVLIPSHSAIPNWPESNLPSLFLYHDGTMQHELVRLAIDTRQELEATLKALSVIQ
jgi:Phosducin